MLRVIFLSTACLAAGAAPASEFSVSPIRVELQRGVRSAAVTVANDDAQPLRMQLRLVEWMQDADGKDLYRESDDLVYYPRLMTVQPGEKRLVRIGVKAPPGSEERSYRLYIDELPPAGAVAPVSSGVSFTIRFALPIFVAPAGDRARGAIDSIALHDGKLRVAVRNPGNRTFRITTVAARGGAFGDEAGGWYLLPGATRVYRFDIPRDACRGLRRLEVTVKADRLALEGGLDVAAGMCPP